MAKRKILTFDYGATSGRAILGEYENGKLTCTEIHRFENNPVEVTGHLYWDILRLFHECKQGLIKAAIAGHRDIEAVGIDTWGVDFALLDENGMLLANPFAYRDVLTDGELERIAKEIPADKALVINMSGRGDKDIFITSPVFRPARWREFLEAELRRLDEKKDVHDAD